MAILFTIFIEIIPHSDFISFHFIPDRMSYSTFNHISIILDAISYYTFNYIYKDSRPS